MQRIGESTDACTAVEASTHHRAPCMEPAKGDTGGSTLLLLLESANAH